MASEIVQLSLKNKQISSLLLSVLAVMIFLVLETIFPRFFREWEERSLDYRFRLRKPVSLSPVITPIGIDDGSLDTLGTWPWDRSIHARMITLLKKFGVSVIAWDIMFSRPSAGTGDAQLIEAMKNAGNVVLPASFQLVDHSCFTPQEYQAFLAQVADLKDAFQKIARERADGTTCIDLETIDDPLGKTLNEERYKDAASLLFLHAEFLYTGEEDRARVETILQRFPYPFKFDKLTTSAFQQVGRPWLANRASAPMKDLTQAAIGIGHISATPDSDGVFRRVPLAIRVQGQFMPSLAFATVLQYLQVKPEDVAIVPGKFITLHQARFPETNSVQDVNIPVDERLQLRINFPRFEGVESFAKVLNAENSPQLEAYWTEKLQGHICPIGYLSTGTGDIGPNPLETQFFLAFIHSAIINTILTQQFLYDIGWGMNIAVTLAILLLVALLSPRLSPLQFTLLILVTIASYIGISILVFNISGVILRIVSPVLTVLLLSYTLITLYWYATEERERKHLRSAFKMYVSRQMLTKILENPESLILQGQRKEITVLFSDIKAFSTLSDKVEPEVIHRLLNLYFSRMTNVVFKYDGFVDKFIGDGMLCFFGDPIAHPDHAMRAVHSAIDMQHEVRALAPEIRKLGIEPIIIRIGINTGYVIVGNMGSSERMEYTVLGSEVNLAQRLESSATPGQVMISARTHELTRQEIDAREIGDIKVKGFEHPVRVYEINLPFE